MPQARKWNPEIAEFLETMRDHQRFPRTTRFVFKNEDEILIAAERIKKQRKRKIEIIKAESEGRVRPVNLD